MTQTHPTRRATGPDDLLALVPGLLGFHPEDSVVLLTVGDARQPFHARVDLPALEEDVDELAGYLAAVAVRSGVARVAIVVYTDDGARARAVVDALDAELLKEDIDIVCVVRADGEHWWVLDVVGETGGRDYDVTSHPLMAQTVMEGTVVLGSRQELADTLVGTDPQETEEIALLAEEVVSRLAQAASGPLGAEAARHRLEVDARWVAHRVRVFLHDGARLGPDEVARLVSAMSVSLPVRDAAWLEMSPANAKQHVHLWRDVVRRAPVELGAAPAALLGFAAWLSGNGALAWCAAERALVAEPGYRIAILLCRALSDAVPPSAWEQLIGTERRVSTG